MPPAAAWRPGKAVGPWPARIAQLAGLNPQFPPVGRPARAPGVASGHQSVLVMKCNPLHN